jgi:hypothetical protein
LKKLELFRSSDIPIRIIKPRYSAPLPQALTQAINHFRQATQTVNSRLTDQFQVERNWTMCISGLCARIQAPLTAHTLGLLPQLPTGAAAGVYPTFVVPG